MAFVERIEPVIYASSTGLERDCSDLGTSFNLKCCIAITCPLLHCTRQAKKDLMSQQLSISSLFSVLALAGLCAVVSLSEIAGVGNGVSQPLMQLQAEVIAPLIGG